LGNVNDPAPASCNKAVLALILYSLGGLHKTCGNTAPIEIRNKDKWIERERLRWARQFHIPMTDSYPKGFPKPTIALQRFLTSLWLENQQAGHQEKFVKVVDTLWETLWTKPDAGDVTDPKVFASIAAPVLGEEQVKRHVDGLGTPEVKKQLLQNTEASFKDGAFGLPWFSCENAKGEVEGFWGFDHLGQIVRFMDLDGKGEVRALL
jgi:2-hydroxychromene-2-carboxylate isomerase